MSILSPLKADCVVFDVDGVIMDTSKSFPNVISKAIPWIWEHFLSGSQESSPFTIRHFETAKQFPSLNDDYDLCWALTTLAASKGNESLAASFPSPWEWEEKLSEVGDLPIIPWFQENVSDLVPYSETRQVCEEIYFGQDKIRELMHREPIHVEALGLWKQEVPLLSKSWKSLSFPVGIYTGRSRSELGLALEALGWEDFPPELAICSDDGIKKPSPEGLEQICRRLGTCWPIFFGDTASDRTSLMAFGRGDFVAIGNTLKNVEFRFKNIEDAIRALGL